MQMNVLVLFLLIPYIYLKRNCVKHSYVCNTLIIKIECYLVYMKYIIENKDIFAQCFFLVTSKTKIISIIC